MLELLESPCMGQELDREKMRERRRALGLNQTAASARGGFTGVQQWSDIERGHKSNVTMETLARIAAALECDARDLITPVEKKNRKGK